MFRRNLQVFSIIASILMLFVLMNITGCSSKSVSNELSTSTDITVVVNPPSVTIGNTSVIEATLREGSLAIPNQIVAFSVAPSTAGYFSPATDTSDVDGAVATVFTATTTGEATLTVSVLGSSLERSTGITITEEEQEGTGNLNMNISPSLLLANGEDTATLTITVRDVNGEPAPDSTLIFLAAGEKFDDIDGNGYWSNGIDSVIYDANANGIWDAVGFISSTAFTTGGAGVAMVNFVSGNDAQTVYIKATVNDNGISGHVESSIQLNPNAAINSIYLASDSMSLSVKQTGGIETGTIRAICYDYNGDVVPEGLSVNFRILDGPGGGEHLGNVGYGPYVAQTNNQGVATVTIHSGTVSGTIRIRADADTVLSNATQVLVSAGPPKYIVVGAFDCNVDYWDNVGNEVRITAVVSDTFLNPVNDSTVVYFSTDEGTMKSHEERTTEHEGIAKTIWFAGNNVATADGRVLIYAETAGGTVADTSVFYNTHFIDSIGLSINIPNSMNADGKEKVEVQVSGYDLNRNPVISGSRFEGFSPLLKVSSGVFENGCGAASDFSTIQSVLLDADRSLTGGNDDGIGAVTTVSFRADDGGGGVTTHTINLLTGKTFRKNCTITAVPTTADYDAEVRIEIEYADSWGNPLGDHTLVPTVNNGATVLPATAETDAGGYAEFIITMPAAATGAESVTISIDDTDPLGGITLSKQVTINTNPILNATPTALGFGAVTTNLTFNLINSGSGGTIIWTISDDKTWITTDLAAGTTTTETDIITVTVDRSGLVAGDYTGLISVSSDAGTAAVSVDITVP